MASAVVMTSLNLTPCAHAQLKNSLRKGGFRKLSSNPVLNGIITISFVQVPFVKTKATYLHCWQELRVMTFVTFDNKQTILVTKCTLQYDINGTQIKTKPCS